MAHTQHPDLGFYISFFNEDQSSLDKWLISGLGQGKYKVNLEYHVMLASKEMLKRKRQKKCLKGRGMSKGHWGHLERTPNGQS